MTQLIENKTILETKGKYKQFLRGLTVSIVVYDEKINAELAQMVRLQQWEGL